MIPVIGDPRSGTSLMMNVLKELGVPIYGEKYPMEKRKGDMPDERFERVMERAKKMNPLGFWETPYVSTGMRAKPKEAKDKAVKIISGAVLNTNPEYYDKAIFCARDPRSIAISQQELMAGVESGTKDGWEFTPTPADPTRYLFGTGRFAKWLAENPDQQSKFLSVDFDDLITNPEREIKRICKHLGLKEKKVSIIEKKLRRSEPLEFTHKRKGEVAMKVYEGLKTMELDTIPFEMADLMDELSRERVKWVDEEFGTYRMIPASLHRSLQTNNNKVKDNLLKDAKRFDPTKSPYYSLSEEEYTIQRPADLGDLTRKKVHCTHPEYNEDMTLERFRQLHLTTF